MCLSVDVFPSNDEVCVYLLEYVCPRGPLRPILCPALLPPFPLLFIPHLDAVSLPHPASPLACPLGALHRRPLGVHNDHELKAAMGVVLCCGL